MDPTTTERKVSKYGKPLGRPKGRRTSDLKKTILAIMARYRIPELVWKDLEAARAEMTPKERFQASVILAELGLKAAPKDFNVTTAGSFSLIIEGINTHPRTILAEGEFVSDSALPPIPAREDFGNAGRIKELNAAAPPPLPEPEKDTRFANEVKAEYARLAVADIWGENPAAPKTGIF